MGAFVAHRIEPAVSPVELATCADLFRAYAATLPFDLGFQDFETELATLPGKYAPPKGALLLARDGAEFAGCVAIRPLGDGICEMKRLYVVPAARGAGLGRRLVTAALAAAIRAGHREMRLDTLPTMPGALALYREAGFTVIAPYYETPVAETIFLARALP